MSHELSEKSRFTITVTIAISMLVTAFALGRMLEDREIRLISTEKAVQRQQQNYDRIERRLQGLDTRLANIESSLHEANTLRVPKR